MHQIAIILLPTDILESTLLEFYGTYFGSQKGGLDVLFTTPSMNGLASNDDDDRDGEVQLHVDVCGCFEFLNENIPSGDDLLTIETAMNRSMTNHEAIAKAIVEECQLGAQILCVRTTTILHQVHEDIHALQLVKSMDTFHLAIVFQKVNDGLPNIEKRT